MATILDLDILEAQVLVEQVVEQEVVGRAIQRLRREVVQTNDVAEQAACAFADLRQKGHCQGPRGGWQGAPRVGGPQGPLRRSRVSSLQEEGRGPLSGRGPRQGAAGAPRVGGPEGGTPRQEGQGAPRAGSLRISVFHPGHVRLELARMEECGLNRAGRGGMALDRGAAFPGNRPGSGLKVDSLPLQKKPTA